MAHQTPPPETLPTTARGRLSSAWKGKSPMSLRSHELAVETTYKQHENGSSEAVFNLVPGPGTHYFRYGGSWFQVSQGSAHVGSMKRVVDGAVGSLVRMRGETLGADKLGDGRGSGRTMDIARGEFRSVLQGDHD